MDILKKINSIKDNIKQQISILDDQIEDLNSQKEYLNLWKKDEEIQEVLNNFVSENRVYADGCLLNDAFINYAYCNEDTDYKVCYFLSNGASINQEDI